LLKKQKQIEMKMSQ